HELTGRRTTLAEMRRESDIGRQSVEAVARIAPEIDEQLHRFEAEALTASAGLPALLRTLTIGSRRRRTLRACRRALAAAPTANSAATGQTLQRIREYLKTVQRTARFGAYERIFSLWHALHLPLCGLLFAAAVVHVIAVHLY
ncbi:MAG TPA: hypothetical protein VFH61_03940, partial [Thermoleophilia bacterium]|nr:hypothetical protein [Thermoleophilia bacterium]